MGALSTMHLILNYTVKLIKIKKEVTICVSCRSIYTMNPILYVWFLCFYSFRDKNVLYNVHLGVVASSNYKTSKLADSHELVYNEKEKQQLACIYTVMIIFS